MIEIIIPILCAIIGLSGVFIGTRISIILQQKENLESILFEIIKIKINFQKIYYNSSEFWNIDFKYDDIIKQYFYIKIQKEYFKINKKIELANYLDDIEKLIEECIKIMKKEKEGCHKDVLFKRIKNILRLEFENNELIKFEVFEKELNKMINKINIWNWI